MILMDKSTGGLAELHAYLVAHFPLDKPPALITLKRWSAQGRFESFRIKGTKRRSIDLEKAAKMVMGSASHPVDAEQPTTTESPERPKSGNQSPASESVHAEALAEIAARLDGLTHTVERLSNAVNNLEAVRRALMAKYDESNTYLQRLVSNSRGSHSSMPGDSGDILTMARIAKRLQSIEEHLGALRAP